MTGEIAVRYVIGIYGILNPEEGLFVQQVLIWWGVIAWSVALIIVMNEQREVSLPLMVGVGLIGLSVWIRIPPATPMDQVVMLGLGTWTRLSFTAVAAALFARYLPECVDRANRLIANTRARLLLHGAAVGLAGVLGLRLAFGYAWAWSPQQPVPYILLAALGSAGALNHRMAAALLAVLALSLKRSAYLGIAAMLLVRLGVIRTLSRRVLVRGAVAVVAVAMALIVLASTPIGSTVSSRALNGLDQLRQLTEAQADVETSFGGRIVENSLALEGWSESATSVLFGMRLERVELSSKAVLTVHNTPLSMLALGGASYIVLVVFMVITVGLRGTSSLGREHYRWYGAASAGAFVESLAGNALLTVTFAAALGTLAFPRRRVRRSAARAQRRTAVAQVTQQRGRGPH